METVTARNVGRRGRLVNRIETMENQTYGALLAAQDGTDCLLVRGLGTRRQDGVGRRDQRAGPETSARDEEGRPCVHLSHWRRKTDRWDRRGRIRAVS